MKLYKFISLAMATLALAACSSDEPLTSSWENDPQALHFEANVAPARTSRSNPTDDARQSVFNENDYIAISNDGETFQPYSFTQGVWTPQSDQYLRWNNSEMEISAYYPLRENTDMNLSVLPTDQSSLEKIALADYMTYRGKHAASENNGTVSIQMKRRTARIIVYVEKITLPDFAASAVEEVKIWGKNSEDATEFSAFQPYVQKKDETLKGTTYTALVVPNATALPEARFVTLSMGTAHIEVPGIPVLEAGKSYAVGLNITKDQVSVTDVSVTDWTEGTIGNANGDLTTVISVDEVNHTLHSFAPGNLNSDLIFKAIGNGNYLKMIGAFNFNDLCIEINPINGKRLVDVDAQNLECNESCWPFRKFKAMRKVTFSSNLSNNDYIFNECNNLQIAILKNPDVNLAKNPDVFNFCHKLKFVDISAATQLQKVQGFRDINNHKFYVGVSEAVYATAEAERETKGWPAGVTFVKGAFEDNLAIANPVEHTVDILEVGGLSEKALTDALGDGSSLKIQGMVNTADLNTIATFLKPERTAKVDLDVSGMIYVDDVYVVDPAPLPYPDNWLQDCKGIRSIVFPNEIKVISMGMFRNSSLESISIYNFTKIGDEAFMGCTALKDIYCIGRPITFEVGKNVFPPQPITCHVRNFQAKRFIDSKLGANITVIYPGESTQNIDVSIGDYMLRDGSILKSSDIDFEKKKNDVIGIVCSLNKESVGTTAAEQLRAIGSEPHGLVIAIKKSYNTNLSWGTNIWIDSAPKLSETMYSDFDGLGNTEALLSLNTNNAYPVLTFVQEYRNRDLAPKENGGGRFKTTDWFLPSEGQMTDMVELLGGGLLQSAHGYALSEAIFVANDQAAEIQEYLDGYWNKLGEKFDLKGNRLYTSTLIQNKDGVAQRGTPIIFAFHWYYNNGVMIRNLSSNDQGLAAVCFLAF